MVGTPCLSVQPPDQALTLPYSPQLIDNVSAGIKCKSVTARVLLNEPTSWNCSAPFSGGEINCPATLPSFFSLEIIGVEPSSFSQRPFTFFQLAASALPLPILVLVGIELVFVEVALVEIVLLDFEAASAPPLNIQLLNSMAAMPFRNMLRS